MCGLFGYSFKDNTIPTSRLAVLSTNLARYNDNRGGHSWGFVGIRNNRARIARGLGELSDHSYELCGYNILVGHTRWATNGEPTIKNAHPFRIGKIVGAHNGMIFNHKQLCHRYRRNFAVDSMHLFAHLNAGKNFNDMAGYGTIEWLNIEERGAIRLCKLQGGELSVVGIGSQENPDGIVWSSSREHLLKSLFAAGIENFHRRDIRQGNVYVIKNGRMTNDHDMKLSLGKRWTRKDQEELEQENTESQQHPRGWSWEVRRSAHIIDDAEEENMAIQAYLDASDGSARRTNINKEEVDAIGNWRNQSNSLITYTSTQHKNSWIKKETQTISAYVSSNMGTELFYVRNSSNNQRAKNILIPSGAVVKIIKSMGNRWSEVCYRNLYIGACLTSHLEIINKEEYDIPSSPPLLHYAIG